MRLVIVGCVKNNLSAAAGIPAYSLGYLYFPAFCGLLVGSVIGTPIGIRIVKKCPEAVSLWLFRLILIYVIIDML